MTSKDDTIKKELQEFENNPYDHNDRRPEDVVRLFYLHDVPIIPVVSKKGILLGILRKETVIAELSDIERVEQMKIDEFITQIASRMTFDDLLPYGKMREFTVINIFGEVQGTWSRLQLFSACERGPKVEVAAEVKQQKEDEELESMIFTILENIPRALYAVNEAGKTIFYNGHFENIYLERFESEVDVVKVEQFLSDPALNEILSQGEEGGISFLNLKLNREYERVPMSGSSGKNGYLLYFKKTGIENGRSFRFPGIDMETMSLPAIMQAVERQLIVDALGEKRDVSECAEKLGLSRQALKGKIKKMGIEI